MKKQMLVERDTMLQNAAEQSYALNQITAKHTCINLN